METHAKHILKLYAEAYPHTWVRHHLESYDDFLTRRLPEYLKVASEKFVHINANRKIKLYICGKSGDKIRYMPPTGTSGEPLFPNESRLKDITYAVTVLVDIDVDYTVELRNGETKVISKTIKDYELCKLPLPVLSKYCNLSMIPPVASLGVGECMYEIGGYFIVDGAEKVLISQEGLAPNVLYVDTLVESTEEDDESPNQYYVAFAEVRSGNEDGSILPRSHKLWLCKEKFNPPSETASETTLQKYKEISKRKGLVMEIPGLSEPVPAAILFRALGIETDEEIVNYMLLDMTEQERKVFAPKVIETLLQRNLVGTSTESPISVFNTDTAIKYIQKLTRFQSQFAVYDLLNNNFLPHLGDNLVLKAYYLGMMCRKVLGVYLGMEKPSDRDHYKFKRLMVTGDLFFNLFVNTFNIVREDFIRSIDLKLNYDVERYKDEKVQSLLDEGTIGYHMQNSRSDFIMETFKKSFKGMWEGKNGVSQKIERTSYKWPLALLRRTLIQISKQSKNADIMKLHGSTWGLACPCDVPEKEAGIIKQLALMAVTSISTPSIIIKDILEEISGFKYLYNLNPSDIRKNDVRVFLNGAWIGLHSNPTVLSSELRSRRTVGKLPKFISIAWYKQKNEFVICTDSGRLIRPVYRFNNLELLNSIAIESTKTWDEVLNKYIDYVDAEESETILISMTPAVSPYVRSVDDLVFQYADKLMPYTHSEIHPSFALGLSVSTVPYSENNASVRNTYVVQQTRQAAGIYATNWKNRFDTLGLLLYTPQVPLVQTETMKYVGDNRMMYGSNSVLAIMSHTGYNQEDSVIINSGALKRNMFLTGYYNLYEASEKFVDMAGEIKSEITNPIVGKYVSMITPKDGIDYSYLDTDGIIKEGTHLGPDMALIGMVTPEGDSWKDSTVVSKKDSHGIIDSIFRYRNPEGLLVVKIKVRDTLVPGVGDKFVIASCAQKGTVGVIMDEEDMPTTSLGLRPDIIMNPHAIPSRMTQSTVLEMLTGKVGSMEGAIQDATAFVPRDDPLKFYGDVLEKNGFNRLGEEYMYNGMTGERIRSTIFVGSVYYSRLKHMVQFKINSRETGPMKLMTHQPTGGRANDGGLRRGEMERDTILSHGISKFIRESMMDRSDGYSTILDEETGRIDVSKSDKTPTKIDLPYSMKLVLQEMESMCVETKLITL